MNLFTITFTTTQNIEDSCVVGFYAVSVSKHQRFVEVHRLHFWSRTIQRCIDWQCRWDTSLLQDVSQFWIFTTYSTFCFFRLHFGFVEFVTYACTYVPTYVLCICICMYVCMYYVYIYVCMYVWMDVCMYVLCIYLCMYVCIMYMYVCMDVCICVCVCMYRTRRES